MTAPKDDMKKAAALIRAGGVVAFPTETVYGLGGNALSDMAVAKIYATKGRPQFNPLIVHVASMAEAHKYVEFSDTAKKLAAKFWPGPLTLVMKRKDDCKLSLLVSAGLDSVAIRVPAHPLAQALLAETELPIAAPSANKSGRISPTEAQHVRDEFGDSVSVLDGGACIIGIESTVVDVTGEGAAILRPGSITREQLEQVVGKLGAQQPADVLRAPGMLESHYAPGKPLRLNVEVTDLQAGDAWLAFGHANACAENLSPTSNLQEAAANLFRMLRKLDAGKAAAIAVSPIPNIGLGVAINDRLKRAAAPKN